MSTASRTNSSTQDSTRSEGAARELPPQGLEVKGVGNLTKDPHIGEKFTAMNVAFNHNYRDKEGKWQQGEPTFAEVVVVGEAHRAIKAGEFKKGTMIQVEGPLETEVRPGKGEGAKEFKDLKIKVFDAKDIKVLKQPKPKEAGAQGDSQPQGQQGGRRNYR